MKFVADFALFLENTVNLNPDRLNRLQKRVDSIETFFSTSDLDDIFLDLIPAGSWAHRTIIRPVATNDTFDADVLLHLKEQPKWEAKDYLESAFAALKANATYKEMIGREPKTRCVRINYADDFHVDVVPYITRHESNFITNRLDPTDTGKFELSNPEAFTKWLDERQRITNGNFIKVVRLIKYLRDHKNTFSCKSIILKTLLGNCVSDFDTTADAKCYSDLPTSLLTIVTKMAESLPATMPAVMDPGGTGDNFTDRYPDWNYVNFKNCVISYASKISSAHAETDRDTSIKLWQEVFGSDFKSGTTLSNSMPLSASSPWAGEKFIDKEPHYFPIVRDVRYKLQIQGRVTGLSVGSYFQKNGFQQYELSRRGNRVRKNRSITFKAATSVPLPYEMYWKIRNGGQDADAANQLRGEIQRDKGQGVHVETTSYSGSHYVECYIVKDEIVVALDRQAVVVVN
jgi:Second Messenger Oligonucleotide or Dinucleotide Synthetase domain/Adenylyl/Guanylyl and SMODS C-terminal sensor domain